MAHIIQSCSDIKSSGLIKESENVCSLLKTHTKDVDVLVTYHLSLASNYLKNNNREDCLLNLNNARKHLLNMKSSNSSLILSARFWYLVSKYLLVYPGFEENFDLPQKIGLGVLVYKAFNYITLAARDSFVSKYNFTLIQIF